jgi:hypothetical protein
MAQVEDSQRRARRLHGSEENQLRKDVSKSRVLFEQLVGKVTATV